jgi:PAS domain-containing protein
MEPNVHRLASAPDQAALRHYPVRRSVGGALRKICGAETYAWALDQVAIVAVTDTKGTIVYANEQFVRISKYQEHE